MSFCNEERTKRTTWYQLVQGLKINVLKRKALRIGTSNNFAFHERNVFIEDVEDICYLGIMVTKDDRSSCNIISRIRKASAAFSILHNVWRSIHYTNRSKIRLFNINVKSVLMYGCEMWKVSKELTNRLQVFIIHCLRKILRMLWPVVITNNDLLEQCNKTEIGLKKRKQKSNWIGHTLRRPANNISRMALDWNPQGRQQRGRPKSSWKRWFQKVIADIGRPGYT